MHNQDLRAYSMLKSTIANPNDFTRNDEWESRID
jgi:hypothetical protein